MPEGLGGEGDRREGGGRSELSFRELLSALTGEIHLLLRQETALFRAELREARDRVGRGVFFLAFGALFFLGGFLALLAAAALALQAFLAPPFAALVVGLLALLFGGVLLVLGKRALRARSLMPRRTLASLRADDAFLREELR
jgi:Putative Actinobacterial Holin-X, holin superfamily III